MIISQHGKLKIKKKLKKLNKNQNNYMKIKRK